MPQGSKFNDHVLNNITSSDIIRTMLSVNVNINNKRDCEGQGESTIP